MIATLSDIPRNALATLPEVGDARRVRVFASEPSVLEAYLIFEAFLRKSNSVSLYREGQDTEEWVLCDPGGSREKAFEDFFHILCTKNLNALNVVDGEANFSYFDWDDRFFIVGGLPEFLSVCYPMPLYVGRMHFEATALNSTDEHYLLSLWNSLAHLM